MQGEKEVFVLVEVGGRGGSGKGCGWIAHLTEFVGDFRLFKISVGLLHDGVTDVHTSRYPRHEKFVFHLETFHDEHIEPFPPFEEHLQLYEEGTVQRERQGY